MRAGLAAIAAAVIGLAGCTKTGTESHGRHAWTQPGVLRIAMSLEPKSLNPLLAGSTFEGFVDRLMFEPLLSADRTGNTVPMLAAVVPTERNGGISRDGLTITYHLRNARWSDRVPVTSHDVLWTWQAIENSRNDVISHHGYDQVRAIDTPDARTVVVHLRRRFSPFVNTFFAESDAPYDVLPAHVLERYPEINDIPFSAGPSVVDGPFRFVAWKRGDRVVLAANPGFFAGPPRLRRIEIAFVGNEDTEVNLLRTHAIDYIFEPSSQIYPLLSGIPNARVVWMNPNAFEGMEFNLTHPIVADPLVRRAISTAIDRTQLVKELAHGQATVARGDLPDWLWAFDPRVQPVRYDPGAAQALLARAGWKMGSDGFVHKNGRPLQLLLVTETQTATHRDESVLIQAALHRIGVDVRVKYYPQDMLYAPKGMGGILHGGRFDIVLFPWISGVDPDNSSQFACVNVPPRGYNDAHYCNPEMDAAQQAALSHYDRAGRKAAYATIERLLARDDPTIFFWWERQQEAISDDFRGFAPNPVVEAWNAWEWSI
ncbi:MAG: peptide ABC transporter substrate-binding protein [Candidatus Baltobacteraceae bacterium]